MAETDEPVSTALTVVKLGIAVAKKLEERKVFERLVDFFKKKPSNHILLFGNSGAGKSSLLRYMRGLPAGIATIHRTKEEKTVDGTLQSEEEGKHIFTFHDMPGGAADKAKRDEATARVYHHQPLGVINVVSYGYHEGDLRAGSTFSPLDGNLPNPSFLENRRASEVEQLREWTKLIGSRHGASWVLTVVTKADLWYTPETDAAVMDYYMNGAYFESLGDVSDIHDVRRFSSVDQLFHGKARMSGYYTDEDRKHDRALLIERLCELAMAAKPKKR